MKEERSNDLFYISIVGFIIFSIVFFWGIVNGKTINDALMAASLACLGCAFLIKGLIYVIKRNIRSALTQQAIIRKQRDLLLTEDQDKVEGK